MEVREDNSEIKKNAERQLFGYVYKGVRKINVLSPINNEESIFHETLNWALSEKKKIIYIVNEKSNTDILGEKVDLKKNNNIKKCTYNEALYVDDKFDIVIYNEVLGVPIYSKESIEKELDRLCGSYGTIIAYSFEKIFDNEVNVYNFEWNRKKPIIEPRVVTTRVDMETEIPMNVYNYIKWSINTNKRVLIYVPSEDKVDKVCSALDKIKDKLKTKIYKKSARDKSCNILSNFKSVSEGILVTDDFIEDFKGVNGADVMLFFADSPGITYKDLIYISGKGEQLSKNGCDEIIFVCKTDTFAMDKCKSVLRELNKKAWEQNLYLV